MYDHRKPVIVDSKPWEQGTKTRVLYIPVDRELSDGIEQKAMMDGVERGELIRRVLWDYVMGEEDE